MPRKKQLDIAKVRLPASRDEVNDLIGQIAAFQNTIAEIERRSAERVAAVQKEAADEIAPLKNRLQERVREVAAFCAANRETLTQGGRVKTVRFPAGEVSWRMTAGKVVLKGVRDVLGRIKTLAAENAAFAAFLRVKEEIDKEAMLKDPERAALIQGVTIQRGEVFSIKPLSTDIEEMV